MENTIEQNKQTAIGDVGMPIIKESKDDKLIIITSSIF